MFVAVLSLCTIWFESILIMIWNPWDVSFPGLPGLPGSKFKGQGACHRLDCYGSSSTIFIVNQNPLNPNSYRHFGGSLELTKNFDLFYYFGNLWGQPSIQHGKFWLPEFPHWGKSCWIPSFIHFLKSYLLGNLLSESTWYISENIVNFWPP